MSTQKQLEDQIRDFNESYRAGYPNISDQKYDILMEQLAKQFPKSALLKKGVLDKPTSRKQKLPLPMFSLNKCKSVEEIRSWVKAKGLGTAIEVVITPKFDGISLVVEEYSMDCWTRGDGTVGQSSDRHFSLMNRGNHLLEHTHTFGEAIMRKEKFKKYKSEFANPRNLVAGLFNRDIPTEALKDVDYVRYGSTFIGDKADQLDHLNEFCNSEQVQYRLIPIETVTKKLLDDLYTLWSEHYQIDGLVIDVNNRNLRENLGREDNNNPAYAIAYKNPEWSGSAEVEVTGITWQVSKQGKLKPVIQIVPTEVAGVVITNVTGYNAKYIFDNNISRGSIIKIIRSGDVIPKHIETISFFDFDVDKLRININWCPCCDSRTSWDETRTELMCTNPACKDQQIMKLVHFFAVLEIEDFGEPSIRRFYDAGYTTVYKIMNMGLKEMEGIEGWGERSALKLWEQQHKLVNIGVPLAKLIHSIDVMDGKIGEKTIQLIFDNLPADRVQFGHMPIEQLIQIDGVAQTTAEVFLEGIRRYSKLAYTFINSIKISHIQTPKAQIIGDKFKGQKICFTGCRPSKEMEAEIQAQGGEVVSGVSAKTTILVVKDITSASSKMSKAKELGIKIITINTL